MEENNPNQPNTPPPVVDNSVPPTQEADINKPVSSTDGESADFLVKHSHKYIILAVLAFIILGSTAGFLIWKNTKIVTVEPTPTPTPEPPTTSKDPISTFSNSKYSFQYPQNWSIQKQYQLYDNNQSTFDTNLILETTDREIVDFREFSQIEKQPINTLFNTRDKGILSPEPEIHYLSQLTGSIQGNDLLVWTLSDDTPPNGPAWSNSHDPQTFILATFWCEGSYFRFEYFGLNQGSNIEPFRSMLNSFSCSTKNKPNDIPEIDQKLFAQYPPAKNFIDLWQ